MFKNSFSSKRKFGSRGSSSSGGGGSFGGGRPGGGFRSGRRSGFGGKTSSGFGGRPSSSFGSRSGGGRPGGGFRGRSGGGGFHRGNESGVRRQFVNGRTIKTFNPTDFINAPKVINKEEIYEIKNSFKDFNISDKLKANIIEKGYKTPTPIQDQAIPLIVEGRDLIGMANTGTGKTAAFLIPLINKVLNDRSHKVLIITPTRELAAQIREEFSYFSKGLQVFCTLCIGGSNIRRQQIYLKSNPNFVVGTPGRLKDLIETRHLDLSDFGSIVLDEADHMVDMGFIRDIKFIITKLKTNRQSLFFSATIDGTVKEILNGFVRNPVTVSVKSGTSSQNVEQKVIKYAQPEQRTELLHNLLAQEEFDKVLIFGRTKQGVQKLSEQLTKLGLRADAIHGNKRQSQRLKTLENFKRNNIKILTATDVAARGLDIPSVSHVINYDLPESQEAYVHRIGRTGRADKKGIAITFVPER